MYLLDTCALLWYLYGHDDLSQKAADIIETEKCCFSYVSFWEIGIKQSKGLFDFDLPISTLETLCLDNDFIPLNLKASAIEKMQLLPYHHKDPFDRMLIAQAQDENLILVTSDSIIQKYEIKTVW